MAWRGVVNSTKDDEGNDARNVFCYDPDSSVRAVEDGRGSCLIQESNEEYLCNGRIAEHSNRRIQPRLYHLEDRSLTSSNITTNTDHDQESTWLAKRAIRVDLRSALARLIETFKHFLEGEGSKGIQGRF